MAELQAWVNEPVPHAELLPAPVAPIITATADDAGCWVDGVRGRYAQTAMVRIAVARGWPITDEDAADIDAYDDGRWTDDDIGMRVDEITDDAENWLTDHVAPEGYSFGWSDGDFLLASEAQWCVWSGEQCYCVEPHDDGGQPLPAPEPIEPAPWPIRLAAWTWLKLSKPWARRP